MTPKQWISGIVQNLYTVLEGVFAKKSDVHTVTSGEFIGSMDRTDVTSSGNVSVRNTSGTFPTVPAGTYMVKTYMLSSTSSYTLTVTFGGQTYALTTSTGELSDTRELTFASSATWSAQITTVASKTRLKVQVYSTGQIVSVVGPAAVSNDYDDLYNTPTSLGDFANDIGYITSQDITGKQDVLVSGTSIKTINSTSLLESGNLDLLPLSGGTTTGPIVVGELNGQLISTAQTTIDNEYVRIDNGLFGSNLRKAELNSDKIKYSVSSDTYDLAFPATSGTIALTSDIPSVSGKEDTTNKVTSLSSSSTDTQYPSAKCVYDLLGDVETLINAL